MAGQPGSVMIGDDPLHRAMVAEPNPAALPSAPRGSAAAPGTFWLLGRLAGSGTRTQSRQSLVGGKLKSDGRPQRCRARRLGRVGDGDRALLRPFAPVPVALGARPIRIGVPPTRNRHVTDTLPHELWLGVPLSTRPGCGDLGPKASNEGGQKTHSEREGAAGSASADSRLLGHRPLGGGILELSAEAHTPAIAIRRKIARGHISNPDDSQTPNCEIFFSPRRDRAGSGQIRGSSWSSAATTARSSRSRS
jgi:hypothetical protein